MSKKLAIRGHSTRGKEVIELLEMMGGKNIHNLYGNNSFEYYVSGHAILNDRLSIIEDDDFVIFNLEEFLEKYPFKVGDKVMNSYGDTITIKSMEWSEDCETMVYDFEETENVLCAEDIGVANDMGLKIENTNMNIEFDLTKYSYEVKDGKLVISEKKPKYPDNYEECVRIAKNIHGYDIHIDAPAYRELLESFVKLLICRDAYWKITGEEMGLGKPWEPAVQNTISGITRSKDEVEKYSCRYGKTRLLEFPTIKMRDAFYENFKDLIEECKELL